MALIFMALVLAGAAGAVKMGIGAASYQLERRKGRGMRQKSRGSGHARGRLWS
jgi:hypothetical protein